ncbi:unnamed protein product [Adineta steineri]|uniref:Prospero domain-containing protein n=2 Tax=Adineta steineri TaxID=433720 RepID=A0A815CHT1_9BILA|nr:unnamed protein product [Adineta steineri]CAF3737456.1 unnamed protein product [Adineta steineri]
MRTYDKILTHLRNGLSENFEILYKSIQNKDDLIVIFNCELFRILNLHYNRSNQINISISCKEIAQGSLKEFFVAIQQQ